MTENMKALFIIVNAGFSEQIVEVVQIMALECYYYPRVALASLSKYLVFNMNQSEILLSVGKKISRLRLLLM